MAATRKNTKIDAEEYQDVYSLSSVCSGSDVIIQNVGTTDLYFTISQSKPLRDNDAYRILMRGDFISVDRGDPSIWMFSPQSNGLINVRDLVSSDIFDLLNTRFLLFSSKLSNIIEELELLNLRTEEMGNTRITKRDTQ